MEEQGSDIISSLPNDILFHIISLVPFNSVIQTIFLSNKWKHLWSLAVVIQNGTIQTLSTAVLDFLSNFDEKNPTKNSRKLQFQFGNANVMFAIIGPNNKLNLNFLPGNGNTKKFGWELDLSSQNSNPTPSSFYIKTLCLISVTCVTSNSVSSIISNLEFLEDVKIIRCRGLRSFSVDSPRKLQSLTIFDCEELQSLLIKCCKMKSLRCRGLLPRVRPDCHFNLAEAMFDSRQGPAYGVFRSVEFDPVLLTIKNTEVLTLCRWFFEDLICSSLSSFEAEFQFYKLKELWWIDCSMEEDNINALISFLKLCPSLERLFITIDPKTYGSARTVTLSEKVGKHTKLQHLKLVKIEGFTRQYNQIFLAKRLQEIVRVELDPLVVWDGQDCFKSFVMSLGMFIEGKDTKELPLKHPHMGL